MDRTADSVRLKLSAIIRQEKNELTLSEIVALAAVVLSIGTNVALYVHLSSIMNTRFDSVERRLEMLMGNFHEIDVRLTKLEP